MMVGRTIPVISMMYRPMKTCVAQLAVAEPVTRAQWSIPLPRRLAVMTRRLICTMKKDLRRRGKRDPGKLGSPEAAPT
jgi:hypothetical protein